MASSEILQKSALQWILSNTNIKTLPDPLTPEIELFCEKYGQIMSLSPGVSSESISGLSQSFNIGNINGLLRQYAKEILGAENTPSDVKAYPALEKWVY